MTIKVRPYRNGRRHEVDIRFRLPDGTWYRERLKAPVSSRSGALRWGQDRERHLLLYGPTLSNPPKEVPTLDGFEGRFINGYAIANQQKPSSIASKRTILRVHLKPALGSKQLTQITDAAVQELKYQLRDKSPKTVNNILTTLNVILKMAVEWKVIDQMPCTIRLLPVHRREPAFHDFEPYERLLVAARAIDERSYLIALIAGEAGLRASEIIALKRTDIDFERGLIYVRHSDYEGQLLAPKNGNGRVVPMTTRLSKALREHRHLRSQRVLCKDDGSPLTRQGAWSRVRYAALRAGVPTGVHILRHTFGAHLTTRGAVQRARQDLLGHRSPAMTDRYSHLSPGSLADAITLLEYREPAGNGEIVETAASGGSKHNR